MSGRDWDAVRSPGVDGGRKSPWCLVIAERQTATATEEPMSDSSTETATDGGGAAEREPVWQAPEAGACSNKGAPGVDGMTVDELPGHLKPGTGPSDPEQLLSALPTMFRRR